MRKILLMVALATSAAAQPAANSDRNAYKTQCGSCHGADLNGGTGPSILGFVRFHTDAEITDRLRNGTGHPSVQTSGSELSRVMAEIRVLAKTNPAMATGGFTGARKFVWGKSGRPEPVGDDTAPQSQKNLNPAPHASAPSDASGKDAFIKVCSACHSPEIAAGRGDTEEGWRHLVDNMVERGAHGTNEELASIVEYLATMYPPKSTGNSSGVDMSKVMQSTASFKPFDQRPATLSLDGGGTLVGTLLGQTASNAQLLTANGKIHLLARQGDQYRDQPIEPKADWLSYHGDLAGDRYSRLEKINRSNIRKLTPVWKFLIPTSSRLQATPTVVDGIMYMTGWNELYALDATTGHQIWAYHEPHTNGILSEAGQGSNRGVALSGDRVFFMLDDARLLAFDRKIGAKLWESNRGSAQKGVSATPAPLVVGDLVLVGVSGGEEGLRGFVDAYKVDTGEHVWRFYTIPKRGEKGSETWIGQALEHGCGSTWMTGSYDPALDLVYWGTGNPCPDYNGSERKGVNLYTDSIVALSAKTGELKWYFQFTPHDTHDWDATQSMILVDDKWNGLPRKLVVHGDRNGYFFVLDRTNGKLLLASPLSSKVTWNTGYGQDGHPVLTSTFEASPGGTALCPAAMGGANWPDPSYNSLTKFFYVRVSDSCGVYASSGEDPLGPDNRWSPSGKPTDSAREALKELTKQYPNRTFIRAIDIATGKKVWDYSVNERSGVLSTAGELVFIGGEGGISALDARNGKELASVNSNQPPTALPVFAASPMTYMVGGKQYVVLAGMGNITAYALAN